MANEATDTLTSFEVLRIPARDYMREFVGTQMSIVDAKIDSLQKLNESTALATQRAVDKAEVQMNSRLEGMNEFREQLKDQASTFVKLEAHSDLKDNLSLRIGAAETSMLSFVKREDAEATRMALAGRTEEFRNLLQARIEVMEKVIANWQGRFLVMGAVWSVGVVVLSALVNYALRTAFKG